MPVSNVISFICGKTGCGKSFLLNYLIHKEYFLKRRQGIVVLDFRGDHLNLLKQKEFKYLRISGNILNNYNIDWVNVLQEYPYLIVEPWKLTQAEYQELGNQIALGIVEVQNRVFFLEEAQLCFSVYDSIKRGFGILTTTGRKIGIDFYFTSQRPGIVNSTAVSQANVRVAFTLDDVNDISRMRGHFPPEIDLTKLRRFEFVAYNVFTHQQVISNTNDLKKIDKIIW